MGVPHKVTEINASQSRRSLMRLPPSVQNGVLFSSQSHLRNTHKRLLDTQPSFRIKTRIKIHVLILNSLTDRSPFLLTPERFALDAAFRALTGGVLLCLFSSLRRIAFPFPCTVLLPGLKGRPQALVFLLFGGRFQQHRIQSGPDGLGDFLNGELHDLLERGLQLTLEKRDVQGNVHVYACYVGRLLSFFFFPTPKIVLNVQKSCGTTAWRRTVTPFSRNASCVYTPLRMLYRSPLGEVADDVRLLRKHVSDSRDAILAQVAYESTLRT